MVDHQRRDAAGRIAPPPTAAPARCRCPARRGWRGRSGRADICRSTSSTTRYWLRCAVDGGNLPLRECVVERVVDILDAHAKPRRHVAVDHDIGLQSALFAVGGDVDNARQLPHALEHLRHPGLQLVDVGAPQRELILRIALPAADAQILRRHQEHAHARDIAQLGAQPGDDRLRGNIVALIERLETDEQASVVDRGVKAGCADRRAEAGDGRIGHHDIHGHQLHPLHRLKRDVGRGLRAAENQAGVVLREIALRRHDKEVDGERDGGDEA